MGGRNAYLYAAQVPQTVERLVVVDIGPEVSSAGSARIRSSVLANDVFDSPEDAFRLTRAANARPSDEDLRQRMEHGLIKRGDGKWTFRFDKALRSPERSLPRPDPEKSWALLARLDCPTLLVRGANSDVLSRETAERMLRTLPHGRLVEIDDCGHSVPLDRPDPFLAAVRPFLLE
jgi:pimeloyl-ACP methyl ester carboxylesterase